MKPCEKFKLGEQVIVSGSITEIVYTIEAIHDSDTYRHWNEIQPLTQMGTVDILSEDNVLFTCINPDYLEHVPIEILLKPGHEKAWVESIK